MPVFSIIAYSSLFLPMTYLRSCPSTVAMRWKLPLYACSIRMLETIWPLMIELMKEMIKRCVKYGIHFEYVLCDSWFTCKEIVNFVRAMHGKHYLGMIKMSKTQYAYNGKMLTANTLASRLWKAEKKHHRMYGRAVSASLLSISTPQTSTIYIQFPHIAGSGYAGRYLGFLSMMPYCSHAQGYGICMVSVWYVYGMCMACIWHLPA